jgi:hypothetical protein
MRTLVHPRFGSVRVTGRAALILLPVAAVALSAGFPAVASAATSGGHSASSHSTALPSRSRGAAGGSALLPGVHMVAVPGSKDGSISGAVLTTAGQGLPGACVQATAAGAKLPARTVSRARGAYLLTGLAPGTYKVAVSRCRSGAVLASGEVRLTPGHVALTANLMLRLSGGLQAAESALGLPAPRVSTQPLQTSTGSISGTVTSSTSTALSGICVQAAGLAGGTSATTGATGTYTISGLAAGYYEVSFSPGCGNSTDFALQYYPDSAFPSGSTEVLVNAGQTLGGINAAMQPGGSISGTVVDSTGTGLSGICVSDLATGAEVNTGSSGSYTLPDLPVGGAAVGFGIEDGAAGNCGTDLSYAGFSAPGSVQVAAGGTTVNVGATLAPGGSITGTVTDEAGTGLAGMCVAVFATAGGGYSGFATATTAAGGGYTVPGLGSGSFIVGAGAGCGGSLAYAPGDYEQGASVAVTAGQATTGIGIVLQTGGSIGGTVTTGAGSPAGICVDALPEGGGAAVGFAATSGSGAYLIPGLSAGLYSVTYQIGCGGTASLIGQTLNDLAVTDQQSTSGVDITLGAAGSISGTVTASGGGGAEGVCVDAAGNGVSTASVNESATTGTTGAYTVLGLPAGPYTVEFTSGCGGSTDYATQYYNGQPTFATAASVTVTGTSDTPGINATMQPAGAISGTVLTASGFGLPGLCVEAFTTTSLAQSAVTGADGAYTITDLAAGNYTVLFIVQGCGQFGGYPTQWYDNQLYVSGTAASVSVASGGTTGSINDTMLSLSGSIAGQVTDSSSAGLGGICVAAIGSGNLSGDGNTAVSLPNGDYTITGLAADTYTVDFSPGICGNSGNYQQQLYNNQPLGSSTPPTTVTLGTGTAATGINDALAAGGTISGTVTDATTGANLEGVCVTATGGSTGDVANGQTGANGSYTLVGLPTDSYTVAFSTPGCGNSGPYAAQFYNNVALIGSATPIAVTAPQAVAGIGDALQYAYPVGSISGTVTSGSSGVGGICVALVSQSGTVVATGVTAGNGSYQIGLQATGTYSVAFFSGCGNLGNYDTEFFGNGFTFPGASVTIGAGANTPNVNANLGAVSPSQPSAPGTPSGTAEPSAVSLSWTAPSSQGSSAISGYLVTPYIGSAAQAALQTNSTALGYTVTGLTDGTAYTFTVAAENASGLGPPSANSAAVTPVAPNPATYNPLTPYRICDTRSGNPSGLSGLDLTQCEGQTLHAGSTLTIQVAGTNPSGQTTGGVPASATSVILNVTVTNTTVPSYLTVYPTGGARPLSSSVNWNGGQTVPNLVTVALGTGGEVSLYNANGSADVVVDVEGWMDSTGASGGPYVPLSPYRICDTRPPIFTPTNQCTGKTLQAATTLTIQVAGTNPLGTSSGGVPPSGVLAVDLTVTATDPTVPSYLTVWPAGETRPVASNLNFVGGETVANNVVVAVPQSGPNAGQVNIYNANGSTDVVVDVSGYYATTLVTGAAKFTPMVPYRICDTRSTAISGLTDSCTGHTLVASGTAGAVLVLQVAGVGGIPSGATSVVLNVTVTDTTAPDYLTIYPDGATRPNSSSLNWPAGETVASGVTATLGSDGALDFYIPQGSADLVVDVVGWEQ